MTFRMASVWCMLALAAPALAQSGAARAEAITGRWTGEFAIDGASRRVRFQLKLDGKGGVSGTFTGLQNPGEVRNTRDK